MDDIKLLTEVDWTVFLITIVLLLSFIVSLIKALEYLAGFLINKFGIETKRQRNQRLLTQTSENLAALQEQHNKDIQEFKNTQAEGVIQSQQRDKEMRNDLNAFMNEIRETVSETQKQMTQFTENRIHDREQSFAIQKELTDSIKAVADGGKRREEQIEAVMIGNRELLGAEIDRRFAKYIELKGIPADELDEFVSLHDAYKGCKGNHNRDAKYEYIIENLPVLPVESKLKDVHD